MKNMDFTRSIRDAWNLMKKLNPDKSKKTQKRTVISADTVAKQIKERECTQIKERNAHIKIRIRTKR